MNIQRCDGCRECFEPLPQPIRFSMTDTQAKQPWVPTLHFCSLQCIQKWLTTQVIGQV